mmetsp:Transcript_101600/g.140409  ORF Transcript_101600/g.140409 Transcript_101600/m.140409 type:complete len:112 (+) Transcript_101600:307-642(+)
MLDILDALIDIFLHTPDVVEREKKESAFWEGKLANMLAPLEKRIENKQFFAANRITIADFMIASIAADYWMNPNSAIYEQCKKVADNYPNLMAHNERILKECEDYMSKRGD